MFRIPERAAWPVVAGLSVVAVLTATIGVVRFLHAAPQPVFADVLIDPQALKEQGGLEPDFEFDFDREARFIAGPVFLGAALKRPEIARLDIVKRQGADPRAWLARNIRVGCPAPRALRISYTGKISGEGATLVNTIAAAYIDEIVNETTRLRAERIDLLERAQCDAKNRLEEKRVAIGRLEGLLASYASRPEGDEINAWRVELETLQKAIEQGADLDVRITNELKELKREPRGTGIALRRAGRR